MTISYETTETHTIDRLEVSVEADDEQDVSYLDDRNEGDINDPDPAIRAGARADAILKAQHGRRWGHVVVVVRSQPDNVVRASLGGIDAWVSGAYYSRRGTVLYSEATERRAERAAEYFGAILSDLVDEAREDLRSQGYALAAVASLPVVDEMGAEMDGAMLRAAAASALDWWVTT